MKLNYKHSVFKAMLLVLAMVLMTVWASSGIVADTGDGGYELVITFQSDEVEECRITYTLPDGTQKKDELVVSGKIYLVKHASEVTGTITPKTGKTPKNLYSANSVVPPIVNNTFKWGQFTGSATVDIVCVNRTYTVKAVEYNLSGDTFYNTTTDMAEHLSKLLNGTVSFTRGDEPIPLPVVSLTSHNFKGWRVRIGDNPDTDYAINADQDGKYYLNDELPMLPYFDLDGVIQVYPVMEPETYKIYREDYIYNALGQHVPLYTYSQEALVHSSISALHTNQVKWADDTVNQDGSVTYKSYPGFLIYEEYNYAEKSVVIPRPDDPTGIQYKNNRVTRYYIPIEYDLVYSDGLTGELLTSPTLPATHTYATQTAIENPAKKGYTFAGWVIKVWDGGNWSIVDESDGYEYNNSNIVKFILGKGNIIAGYGDNDPDTVDKPINDPNTKYASVQKDGKYEIRFEATWEPNKYDITYNWGVEDSALTAELNALNNTLITENAYFKFADNNGFKAIGAAQRPGYTFCCWSLSYRTEEGTWSETEVDLQQNAEGDAWLLPTDLYATEVRLSAKWAPEKYTVVLDPGTDATLGEYGALEVTYDTQLSIPDSELLIPTRRGYTFLGYFSTPDDSTSVGVKYINADGTPVDMLWKLDDADTGSVNLYARWTINSYNISFDSAVPLPEGTVIIVVTGEEINGELIHVLAAGELLNLPYNTQFALSVTSPTGYKLVAFNGQAVHHTASYQTNLTVDAEDQVFMLTVCPTRIMEPPVIHYGNEQIENLATGNYSITWVQNGESKTQVITIRTPGEKLNILNEWFGKELIFVYLGDGIITSDSEPQSITPVARPAAPSILGPDTLDAEILSISRNENWLKINMPEEILGLYEFAIFKYTGSAVDYDSLVWQSSPEFTKLPNGEPLYPGTAYNLYVRIKATDNAPCGVYFTHLAITETAGYIDDIKNQLDDLLGDDAGDVSKELIENAKDQIDQWAEELGAGDNFYLKVENLIQTIRDEQLAIALAKDRYIALLREFRDSCVATGFFIDAKIAELDRICNTAVDGIKNLTDCTEADIQSIYNSAMNAMKAVEIHILTKEDGDASVRVESDKGLYQDSRLTLTAESEFLKLIQAIDKAVRTPGMVTVNGFMTVGEAEEILRSLDVFAFYRFEMLHNDKIKDGDVFTVRLKLTDALKGMTGLCAAYYNDKTGTIELLDSRVEGDYLVFTTTHIADFVVMGDTTLRLEGIILALGVVLLCQLIAIVAVLITRSKAKKQIKHFSIALPIMALTVHFSPVNGDLIVLIMAGAVVLLQIILMFLLFSSGMIRLPEKKKKEPTETAKPTVADSSDDYYADPADSFYAVPPQRTTADEPVEEYADDTDESLTDGTDDPAVGAYVAMEFDETDESTEDPFAFYGEDAETYSEDFIEPAAATRYSLPDDAYESMDEGDGEETEAWAESDGGETLTYADGADEYAYDGTEAVDSDVSYADDAYADEDAAYAEEQYGEEPYDEEDGYADLYATVPAEDPAYVTEDTVYGAEDAVSAENSEYVTEEAADVADSEESIEEEPPMSEDYIDDEDSDSMYRYDE